MATQVNEWVEVKEEKNFFAKKRETRKSNDNGIWRENMSFQYTYCCYKNEK